MQISVKCGRGLSGTCFRSIRKFQKRLGSFVSNY